MTPLTQSQYLESTAIRAIADFGFPASVNS
jgi:hypothetical protein